MEDKLDRIRKAIDALEGQYQDCQLCPHRCSVNRRNNSLGYCRLPGKIKLYKYKLHFGEEPPISGTRGSGILFFSGCTMACSFCQNFPFSHNHHGYWISPEQLAKMMLELQHQGAHNINLVSPTQFLPDILIGLEKAIQHGLNLPLVYNTNGYELVEILELLEGIVDVYLPDMKYSADKTALRYSKAKDYSEYNRQSIKEMYRQVGFLQCDSEGIARSGLIIRHLLLPNDLAGTEEIFRFITTELDNNVHISLMTQYLPIWDATKFPEISRRINAREYFEAIELLEKYQLHRGWIQEFD